MDNRDMIWDKIFEVFYDSYYYELLSNKIIGIWITIDEITKVLVAITTSSSAIAGWALWNKEGWQYIWLFLAGLGALLSIIHATLNVTQRIKEWTENKRNFSSLRIECETNRGEMAMNGNFDTELHKQFYRDKMKLYGELYSNLPNDILVTKKLRIKNQNELDHSIQNLIKQ